MRGTGPPKLPTSWGRAGRMMLPSSWVASAERRFGAVFRVDAGVDLGVSAHSGASVGRMSDAQIAQ